MKVLSILLIAAVIMMKEMPRMVRDRSYKEITVFSIILLLGTIYAIDLEYHLHLPNPTNGISSIFRPFTVWLEHLML